MISPAQAMDGFIFEPVYYEDGSWELKLHNTTGQEKALGRAVVIVVPDIKMAKCEENTENEITFSQRLGSDFPSAHSGEELNHKEITNYFKNESSILHDNWFAAYYTQRNIILSPKTTTLSYQEPWVYTETQNGVTNFKWKTKEQLLQDYGDYLNANGERIKDVQKIDLNFVFNSNGRVSTSFHSIITVDLRPEGTTTATPSKKEFKDVPATAWYAEAVQTVSQANIMNGDGTGNWRPMDYLTWREFAIALYRMEGFRSQLTKVSLFGSTNAMETETWKAIAWLTKARVLTTKQILPEYWSSQSQHKVRRWDVLDAISHLTQMQTAEDRDETQWYFDAKIVDESIDVKTSITRAEFAVILSRTMDYAQSHGGVLAR